MKSNIYSDRRGSRNGSIASKRAKSIGVYNESLSLVKGKPSFSI